MIIFLFLLIIPMSLSLGWALNISNFWMHSASEQVRLDALSLSLCHSRLSFIRNQLIGANTEILEAQVEMDSLTLACSANPYPWACDVLRPTIAALSAAGKALEMEQELGFEAQDLNEFAKTAELLSRNNLESARLSMSRLPSRSAWRRQTLRPDQITYQARMGVSWPLQILPQENFENLNEIRATYRGKRNFLATQAKLQTASGKILNLEERRETLHSVCSLRASGWSQWLSNFGISFKVARLE